MTAAAEPEAPGGWSTALPLYLKIGLLSFGGPAGQIALMQDELVKRRGWVDEAAFQRGLNVSMLLPGPEAQQLATWLGWRLHGLPGGLAAGLSFILPGAGLMVILAWISAAYGETRWLSAVFYGIQPAVLVIVALALWRLAKRALTGPMAWALAGLAFLGIYALGLPFPLIVALAALAGMALPAVAQPEGSDGAAHPAAGHFWRMLLAGGLLVVAVWVLVRAIAGPGPFDEVAELFTTAAFVTFGGAYAVLPFVADRAVESYGWLTPAEMLNGLAIAEATPGPLILVNVYAGFFAGWPDGAGPGAAAAALACFYTFAPSFAMILAVAPYVEAVQRIRWIRQALAGVSAAVVGVVLNLTVYLGEAALIPAAGEAVPWPKLILLLGFALLALWRDPPMTQKVVLGAGAGLILSALGLI